LSKLYLPSTSANGVANYDDDQGHLSNIHYHCRQCSEFPQARQAPIAPVAEAAGAGRRVRATNALTSVNTSSSLELTMQQGAGNRQ
jgi:hypothetical protein